MDPISLSTYARCQGLAGVERTLFHPLQHAGLSRRSRSGPTHREAIRDLPAHAIASREFTLMMDEFTPFSPLGSACKANSAIASRRNTRQ